MSDLPPNRRAPIAPLGYETPADAELLSGSSSAATRVGFSVPLFLLSGFATTVVLLILGGVVPHFAQTFKDFGIKLPVVTEVLLGLSRIFTATPVWVTGPVIVLGVATAVAFIPLPRRAVRLIITLVMTVIVLVFALGILLPLVNLMESISSGGGKK